MEFTVKFKGFGFSHAINSEDDSNLAKTCGLYHLDEARKLSGFNIPIDRINGRIRNYVDDIKITLDEQQARQASFDKNPFEHKGYVVVEANTEKMDDRFMNKYLKLDFDISKNQETGEILSFQFKYVPDRERIIRDWFEDGCPIEWGFEKPKEENPSSIDDEFLSMAHKGNISSDTMQQVVNVLEARMFDGGEEA